MSVEIVGVRSNVDALSAERLHLALVRLVDDAAKHGAEFLRGAVPKRSGEMAAHVGHTDAEGVVDLIEARLGISAVGEANVPGAGGMGASPRFSLQPSDRSHYPLFVSQGTGIFGHTGSPIFARSGGMLRFEHDGRPIYRRSVAGQRAQHFMAATLAFVMALLKSDRHIADALAEMSAQARAEHPL